MKILIKKFVYICSVIGVMLGLGHAAWAKDAVKAAVTVGTPSNAITMYNGTPYSQGTYAIGTIQLFYPVVAYQFTAGDFGYFDLQLAIQAGPANPPTNYSVSLNLQQTGSTNLQLVPDPSNFSVTNSSWSNSSRVHINIPAAVANDPDFQVDGAELVGNLQIVTPGGSHLDTVTTVQVHLILAHPTSCLKSYALITNNDISAQVDHITVSKGSGSGKVSSNPQEPHYILVVTNTCSVAQCMDIQFALNSDFELKGAQAVKTFSSGSEIDTFTEVSSFFGGAPTATPKGQATCLTAPASLTCGSGGIPITAGASFLVKADFRIKDNASFPPPSEYTGFDANILDGGTTGSCTVAGNLTSIAEPNPISKTLNAQCIDGPGKVSCTTQTSTTLKKGN